MSSAGQTDSTPTVKAPATTPTPAPMTDEDAHYQRMADAHDDYMALVDAATESLWEKENL